MLTVIVPSKTERFLKQTIEDVLKNATGEIEILPVLDGYTPPENEIVHDLRVRYLSLPSSKNTQKRHGINLAVSQAKGEYVMSLDAHCSVGRGFDEQLINDHQPNWVQVLRRHRLDPIKWELQPQGDKRPPIDYEYIQYPPHFTAKGFHGFRWDARTLERWDIPIDDIITCQGSMWFMTKKWFIDHGFMDIKYTGFGQEAEEICFTTWLTGGECKVNKKNWYSHLHKGATFGRMYWMSRDENRKSYEYSHDFWLNNKLQNRIHDFDWLIEKFMPMPHWKKNWKEEMGYIKS